ncbi:MAG: DEAD/DEAH box helicase, partial [Bacillota bacterium]|nr:DEAD/DEAH box helicase [Bacillota bacterium]
MTFRDLNISPNIQRALAQEQYTVPTPIQEQAIPPALAGRDLLGVAQTGTGKTAAFAVPILQNLEQKNTFNPLRPARRTIRALVLTPTRELALQIYESLLAYGRFSKLKSCVIFGGVPQRPQEQSLRNGVDILVATPGRLKDLMDQGLIDLSHIEILTLDEADRMLDMGFIHDVRYIIGRTPDRKQTLFFSATMPDEIVKLSRSLLDQPVRVSISPDAPTVEIIDQSVYQVNKQNKRHLLLHLLQNPAISSALVFTRTKHGADRVVRDLLRGGIKAQAIHGNKSQNARQQALQNFKDKATRVLVATDIAARGIDVEAISHVINFDLPEIPESYVHRIGRTGRAGLGGTAISFCDTEEIKLLKDIEKLCAKPIPKVADHPYPLVAAVQDKPPVQER